MEEGELRSLLGEPRPGNQTTIQVGRFLIKFSFFLILVCMDHCHTGWVFSAVFSLLCLCELC